MVQVRKRDIAEMYRKYSNGVKLINDTLTPSQMWSFTGYKKISREMQYDSGGFSFTKALVCFQPCKLEGCHKKFGLDKCCVTKSRRNETMGASPHGEWTAVEKQGIPKVELAEEDGMKVF